MFIEFMSNKILNVFKLHINKYECNADGKFFNVVITIYLTLLLSL